MKIVFFLTLLISSLFAHKLNIFLYEENNKIVLNSYFASGSACKNCKVEIFDDKNKLLQSSKTDEKGDYTFDKLSSKLIVKVEAIGGHAATSSIEVKNINKKKDELSKSNSLIQSLLAAFLIALIFLGLKRIKR